MPTPEISPEEAARLIVAAYADYNSPDADVSSSAYRPLHRALFAHGPAVAQSYIDADEAGVTLMRAYLAALARIAQLESERRWIPVSESLPEVPPDLRPAEAFRVLFCPPGGKPASCEYSPTHGAWPAVFYGPNSTVWQSVDGGHWQYLPPAPAQ